MLEKKCQTYALISQLRRKPLVETRHYEATNGFIPQDSYTETVEIGPSLYETRAADLIESLTQYLSHDVGCPANDFDHLDHTPCTCGLREIYNPKGI